MFPYQHFHWHSSQTKVMLPILLGPSQPLGLLEHQWALGCRKGHFVRMPFCQENHDHSFSAFYSIFYDRVSVSDKVYDSLLLCSSEIHLKCSYSFFIAVLKFGEQGKLQHLYLNVFTFLYRKWPWALWQISPIILDNVKKQILNYKKINLCMNTI
jgi:hypothetical protein